jgi:hypothetical protein
MMNRSDWVIVGLVALGVFLVMVIESYDSGMQRGVAYQKCIDDLGYDCTEQAVEEIYLPVEKEIDEYVYPLKLETERALSLPDYEVSTLGEKENHVGGSCLNNEFNSILICFNNSLGVPEIIYY